MLYFCMGCLERYGENEMVIYTLNTRKGFCRACSGKLTFEKMQQIKNNGFNQGEQLSLFGGEKSPSPLPY